MPHDLIVKIALDAWNMHLNRADALIQSLSDEQLRRDTSPGKNSGVYLLGHLTAVHDRMLPLFGLEDQVYPALNDPFLTSPDKSGKEMPSIQDLKNCWNDVNTRLNAHFSNMSPEDWFQPHTSISEADFIKEPHRNKLNVLVSRTTHLAYHLGQMIYLKD